METQFNSPFFISCKECRIENPRSFYGCFYLGPFKAGQSLTVANALRRTLLSELSGLAITSVYIEGADHEYASLTGVRDSVLDILLNLKEIVLKSSSTIQKPMLGYLQTRGPGVIRACDLKLPPHVQCIDPDQYIATLTHDGILNLKFTICEGKNYVVQTPKRLQQENILFKALSNKVPICLDPTFMPVNKVNYIVESDDIHFYSAKKKLSSMSKVAKQNEKNSYKQNSTSNHVVILEIWTNGSIHPREAMFEALNQLMCLFTNLGKMHLIQSTNTKMMLKSNKNVDKLIDQLIPNQLEQKLQINLNTHRK